MFLFFGLFDFVIDPKLSVVKGYQVGDPLHRQERLELLLGWHRTKIGDAAIVPVRLKVNGVSAQQDPARLGKVHEQRVVAGSVAGRRKDHNRAVAEHVQIFIHQLNRMILREFGSWVSGRDR